MTEYLIEAKLRTEPGEKIRRLGQLPAIVYGKNVENVSISVDTAAFGKLFKEAGTSNLIDLSIDGAKTYKTIVNDVQLDPITLNVIHADFLKVNMKEKIHAEIPLEFIGQSKAVVELEGMLITHRDNVEVECLPGDLPSKIDVDISVLDDFEKEIRVKDIPSIDGVAILDDPEELIVIVEPPRSEEELEALDEAVVEDVSAVEVEADKKDEEGEEAAETKEEK